jgi:hypothetical protein
LRAKRSNLPLFFSQQQSDNVIANKTPVIASEAKQSAFFFACTQDKRITISKLPDPRFLPKTEQMCYNTAKKTTAP